jgi:transposase
LAKQGVAKEKIAKRVGVGVGSVYRVLAAAAAV